MQPQFVETIRYENGRFHLLELHQQRMASTIRETYGHTAEIPDLTKALTPPPLIEKATTLKCRAIYNTSIVKIEYLPYSPQIIKSLKVITADPKLDYHLKYTDRTYLDALSAQKGDCDAVLIIKDGLITDTSYTNIVFRSDKGFYTPRTPLLRGVMRQHLLNAGEIIERDLRLSDIIPGNQLGITEAYLINAMLPLHTLPPIPVTAIHLP